VSDPKRTQVDINSTNKISTDSNRNPSPGLDELEETRSELSEIDGAESEALSRFFDALKSSQNVVAPKEKYDIQVYFLCQKNGPHLSSFACKMYSGSDTSAQDRRLYTHKYSSAIKGSDGFTETVHRHLRNAMYVFFASFFI